MAIADATGDLWPERARRAAAVLSGEGREDHSLGIQLLAHIQNILEKHTSDRIRSRSLVDALCALEEAPWGEYKGRGLSTRSLANFLKGFDISSKQLRFSANTYTGYERQSFEDAFRRYLPKESDQGSRQTKRPKQPRSDRDFPDPGRRNTGADVSSPETDESPVTDRDVSAVSGRGTPEGGEDDRGSAPARGRLL